jgi:hypothetical protein
VSEVVGGHESKATGREGRKGSGTPRGALS